MVRTSHWSSEGYRLYTYVIFALPFQSMYHIEHLTTWSLEWLSYFRQKRFSNSKTYSVNCWETVWIKNDTTQQNKLHTYSKGLVTLFFKPNSKSHFRVFTSLVFFYKSCLWDIYILFTMHRRVFSRKLSVDKIFGCFISEELRGVDPVLNWQPFPSNFY